MQEDSDSIRAIQWTGDSLRLLDQRDLPASVNYLELVDAVSVAAAIRDMVVRGAPAIGITAAYGVVLAARQRYAESPQGWQGLLEGDIRLLTAARPTAVNLAWALQRMQRCAAGTEGDPVPLLLEEARQIHAEDIDANRQMGAHGAALIDANSSVLTYCNTGSLATGGYGTALGVIRSAWAAGKLQQVYASETRPWLQGSRLTAWELTCDRIPVTLITDNAAGFLMQNRRVQWVITGADRVTANGDVINKIGTSSLAVMCRHYDVGFMVVAPCSTLDFSLDSGAQVNIEQRSEDEVLTLADHRIAAAGASAWNPAFDITPADLVDCLVTERGVIRAPDRAKLAVLKPD
ncbi:MAG: S-methyl-5-thioribose-1-phosphate isomerase [Gammaproteobacteria bacterium]|nr:MAG: S-methyl-5-thioribose-1-phosphate isomerase [Gammaproteobacteria bacterium]